MPRLKTKNFYYGAVIETIMSYNEDASPSLVNRKERVARPEIHRAIYHRNLILFKRCKLFG